ncbi:glycoside hydrolase N-terminal domain-containing protein [Mucilaginibacter daejeonensis]|uniref:glycoside hydrolase family 95 protein n=1 Tax=Mucilaginibacter daejeonensis TaxID=398049 RepID=UPI001D176B1F|nr:glycoside hydrolase N-terminal domain-containing protein [Mucilaginibacter daejeonensis]UEG52860.1 glycoside hydrolase N-terminal domain-containing protein [Mucilaginibacter daejeonensis]
MNRCTVSHKLKKLWNKAPLVLFTVLCTFKASAQNNSKLWYNAPAQKWTDALPIGNGSIGGMVYGDVQNDRVQFNENTLWNGAPRAYARKGAYKYLAQIRALIAQGKQKEAEALAGKAFMGLKENELNYAKDSARWVNTMLSYYGPQDELFHPSTIKTISLPTEQGWELTRGLEGLDGTVWFRRYVEIPAGWKGKDVVLSLGRVRDMDVTYFNGERVGSTNGTAYRKYVIPASKLHTGRNVIAVQVLNFNDKGGLTSNAKEIKIYPQGNEAEALPLSGQWEYFIQDGEAPVYPKYNASYQPFADLHLQFAAKGEVTNYRRDLDLTNATAHVSYAQNGVTYTREYLVSAPDKAMAIQLAVSKPGQLTLKIGLTTLHHQYTIRKVNESTLALNLKVNNGVLKGVTYLHVSRQGGKLSIANNGINISGANSATLYLTAATSFRNYHDVTGDPDAICKKRITSVKAKSYAAVRSTHVADYQRYYNTFDIELGKGQNEGLPTDERIAKFNSKDDPGLVALFVKYSRYLLISSSRPDSKLPANLQGIWNDLLTPPWGSKFTTNINLQMNYWSAEMFNLSACTKPLFHMVNDLEQTEHATAKEHYNAPGWVLHHNTDIWCGTAPVNASNHGIWQPGAAWLSESLWEHYQFTQDKAFLRSQAYPAMKGAAEFFVANLVKDPTTGYLISTPSNSPEHGGLVAGPTMDHQIIRELFKNTSKASALLGLDPAFARTLQQKYAQIAPNRIGKYGQLQEWLEDKDDTTDTHRHVSHMWGVHPGTEITERTPELMQAAKRSMYYRGDDGTGWSISWKVNIWARMHDGDHAFKLLNRLLSTAESPDGGKDRGGLYHNMFDAHPPFQIDGNFGAAAGVGEMLLQSQFGTLDLLPALPTALPNGSVKGICARGGFVLNIDWKNGELQKVRITSTAGKPCIVNYAGKQIKFDTQKGATYQLNGNLQKI